MLRILLVLPGSTELDAQGRIIGALDLPLNDQGAFQAKRTAEEIGDTKIDQIYCAPCMSAIQTAEELAHGGRIKTKVRNDLRNVDLGLWQGMSVSKLRDTQPRVYRRRQEVPDSVCPPNGETIEEARLRLTRTMQKLKRKHKSGTIALVVPEPAASLLRCHLEHAEVGDLWKAEGQCGSWRTIEVDAGVDSLL